MTFDFSKSFQQGLDAAELALQKRREINSVIRTLNTQVLSASKGKISIEQQMKTNGLQSIGKLFAGSTTTSIFGNNYLIAKNTSTETTDDLCVFEPSPNGYPCKLEYSDQSAYCNDKESLELQLSDMLSHPDIGKKMVRLMNAKPSTPTEPTSENP